MTLSTQIAPLLDEFKKANGKGNVNIANLALVKIVEALVNHIDHHVMHGTMTMMPNLPVPAGMDWRTLAAQYAPQEWPTGPTMPEGWAVTKPLKETGDITGTIVGPHVGAVTAMADNSKHKKAAPIVKRGRGRPKKVKA